MECVAYWRIGVLAYDAYDVGGWECWCCCLLLFIVYVKSPRALESQRIRLSESSASYRAPAPPQRRVLGAVEHRRRKATCCGSKRWNVPAGPAPTGAAAACLRWNHRSMRADSDRYRCRAVLQCVFRETTRNPCAHTGARIVLARAHTCTGCIHVGEKGRQVSFAAENGHGDEPGAFSAALGCLITGRQPAAASAAVLSIGLRLRKQPSW